MCKQKEEIVSSELKKPQDLYSLYDATKLGQMRRNKMGTLIFNYVTRYLKKNATVLEIGSGRGNFAKLSRQKGFRYIGIEPSASMRKNLVELGFHILADTVPPIKLESESVDMVHSSAVIEHFSNYSEVLKYFSESSRVLKRGGIMSSIVPNCNTIGMIFYLLDYQHNFVTNYGRLEHLSRDTGFEIINSRSFLTTLGLSNLNLLDRIFAHALLLFMRNPIIYSLVRTLCRNNISNRIYKNLFDQTIIIAKKL